MTDYTQRERIMGKSWALSQHSKFKTVFLVASLVLIWGISWPIYKAAVAYTPPLLFSGMRTLLGGLAMAAILWKRRGNIRFSSNARIYIISALFNVVLFVGLQTIGLNYLPGGLFTVIVYIQPVLVGLLAWAWLGESMTWSKIVGLILGFLGVVAVSAEGIFGYFSIAGIVLAILTSISWAMGVIYMKKEGDKTDTLWLVAIQNILGGAFLTGIGAAVESWSDIVWNGTYLLGLIFGAAFAVSTAWVIYVALVQAGEASKVAANTFFVPVIAVIISTLFLHEPVSILLLAGLVLTALGIFLVNRNPANNKEKAKESAETCKKI